jgi:hypothetical protein
MMNTSPTIGNLGPALLSAQMAMGAAAKGASNPFFKSKYADYGSVLEVVKGPLNDAGVVLMQPTIFRDGKTLVLTSLIHAKTGEYITGEIEVVCAKQNDPQAYGSALTYARRYGLQSILSIPTEDNDGEGAMDRAPKKATPAKVADAPKLVTTGLVGSTEMGSTNVTIVNTPNLPPVLNSGTVVENTPKTNSWRKPKPTTPASDDGMEFG